MLKSRLLLTLGLTLFSVSFVDCTASHQKASLEGVLITLSQIPSLGLNPVFIIRIQGDGTTWIIVDAIFPIRDSSASTVDTSIVVLPKDSVRLLLNLFHKIPFDALHEEYLGDVFDVGGFVLNLKGQSHEREVRVDRFLGEADMKRDPDAIRLLALSNLSNRIEQMVDVRKYLKRMERFRPHHEN